MAQIQFDSSTDLRDSDHQKFYGSLLRLLEDLDSAVNGLKPAPGTKDFTCRIKVPKERLEREGPVNNPGDWVASIAWGGIRFVEITHESGRTDVAVSREGGAGGYAVGLDYYELLRHEVLSRLIGHLYRANALSTVVYAKLDVLAQPLDPYHGGV